MTTFYCFFWSFRNQDEAETGEVKESTHVETREETVEKEEKEKEENEEQNKGQDMALVGWFDWFLSPQI